MKIVCAWCRVVLGYKCPTCDRPLTERTIDGQTFMVCSGDGRQTEITWRLETMLETHSICEACASAMDELRKRAVEEKGEPQ